MMISVQNINTEVVTTSIFQNFMMKKLFEILTALFLKLS